MKRTGLLFSLLLITVLSSAQTRTLIQDLERDVQGKGQIRINRDVRLDSLIGYVSDVQSGAFIKAKGYRVQVYSGNNTRASRDKANEIAGYIRNKYPDLPVYTYFRSPRRLCVVGDFLSIEEAHETMRMIKKETPYKEIFILPNQEIQIPL